MNTHDIINQRGKKTRTIIITIIIKNKHFEKRREDLLIMQFVILLNY